MKRNSLRCPDPDAAILEWLNSHPKEAINIAHATLFGRFVTHDEFGGQFLDPNHITDVNDLFNEIDPVVDSTSFADAISSMPSNED